MRSFQRLMQILFLPLFLSISLGALANSNENPKGDFFTITLPYDVDVYEPSQDASPLPIQTEELFEQSLQKAMAILLVRMTGQKKILHSRVGKKYLSNPRIWLKTYDFSPRVQEGVAVGQNILFSFLGDKLQKEFRNRFVPIWPASERPNTLVMGSLVHGKTLIKLDGNEMQYRLDLAFREYPQQIKLPITIPEFAERLSTNQWILPVESSETLKIIPSIQSLLAQTKQAYLLSFKAIMSDAYQYELNWVLYNQKGEPVLTGVQTRETGGGNFSDLTNEMFDQVMTFYAQIYLQALHRHKTETDTQVMSLTVHNVQNPQPLLEIERLLKSQPAMIDSFELVSMQAGKVQYRMSTLVGYQRIVNWVKQWPKMTLVGSVPERRKIDVRIDSKGLFESKEGEQ